MINLLRQRSYRVVLIIITCVFILTRCINNDKTESNGQLTGINQFAGSSKCAGCHQDIYKTHVQTAHFLSSTPAEEKYIKGSFAKDSNRYSYNPNLIVVMEKRDSGLFQVVYFHGEEKIALPFQLVIGSGAKGQTFIHTKGNRFFQLPISYFTAADQWTNSPGFPNTVVFDRPITSRCLECHVSYVERTSAPNKEPEEFDSRQVLYGVDCEKCHGPAKEHITFHTENPNETKGKYIIDPRGFSRQQSLDMCAICHGGKMTKLKPSFEFTAGDKLSDYFKIDTSSTMASNFGNMDVHGNQYGLLKASQCFIQSNTMTCGSCHNPHENERGRIELFSQRCISCHSPGHDNICKMTEEIGASITSNCIDCHMPKQRSMAIALQIAGEEVPKAALIRSHLIGIYPEETKGFNANHSKPANKGRN
jgi:mono/diheme cytochrome c family protein